MIKDIVISGSGKNYTAKAICEFADESGDSPLKKEYTRTGDLQTALSDLEKDCVATGKDKQRFAELCVLRIKEDKEKNKGDQAPKLVQEIAEQNHDMYAIMGSGSVEN